MHFKVKRRKLEIPLPIPEYAERIQNLGKLEILPVDIQTWLENLGLDWDHRDPVDRTIVAIATRLACPIVTSDAVIADFYLQTIWQNLFPPTKSIINQQPNLISLGFRAILQSLSFRYFNHGRIY